MESYVRITSKSYPNIKLRMVPGHFVTAHSHVNYYLDMTHMKSRQNEALQIARAMADSYLTTTIIDTIVCIDGCEVIGAYLANYLTESGIISMNKHKTLYITTPEFSHAGQFLFRENMQHMVKDKHVLILLASATTGKTVAGAVEVIQYYGGSIAGISAIFSSANKIYDYPINALFTSADIPDYQTYSSSNCRLCKENKPIDALVNDYGFSKI
ncbi:phosphoribosyltransferase [Anaerosacchariphilus polymeriproducens]|uniref:Orotate phosphoribosyltransferase n=1 Tax=Anaerosacchariphilus polymeriproducens TaxID=1812858 RepID=A0A371AQX5_9FIRM|nr:phosphoribosyltransferase [Anaerosacchariphilus polymeriproducens]RDU21985.1 orotate phosphoribosyltransferase [Anaerosacchariphilus polymeriproducens]